MTVLERLASFAAAERAKSCSPALLHHAKRALVDWFAALLPGAAHPQTRYLADALRDELGSGRSYVYGIGCRAPLRTAALINAAASHIVEFDDIYRDALYHPGCPTIGAALAAAQGRGATPETLLRAIIVGYEVSARIGVAVQPSHYRFWHTTGTVGTFGAAAAVATVLGLDAERTMHALANAGTMAAGLQQAFRSDSMAKPLHAGHAAEAGALAALGAREGMTGARDLLEGKAGFGAAMSREADWDRALADLGQRYAIAEMTFKNHGCCGHIFAPLDAALELRQQMRLSPERIADVDIGTYQVALDVTGAVRHPASPFEGRFSMAFAVAHALVHGSVRLAAFTPERLSDPIVNALAGKVRIRMDPRCEKAFPRQRSAVVAIETVDGNRMERFQPTRKGDPDAPLSDDELTGKLVELADPMLDPAQARALADSLWRLDQGHVEFATDAKPAVTATVIRG
ncbi:MAG: MmgE/PrpD family protein [Alphaproteobacteria bacterium]|nr:MmgE/PrpD family protein [Alphaproteobacteria bacterium]